MKQEFWTLHRNAKDAERSGDDELTSHQENSRAVDSVVQRGFHERRESRVVLSVRIDLPVQIEGQESNCLVEAWEQRSALLEIMHSLLQMNALFVINNAQCVKLLRESR